MCGKVPYRKLAAIMCGEIVKRKCAAKKACILGSNCHYSARLLTKGKGMKISELIDELEKFKSLHGDVSVKKDTPGMAYPVTGVDIYEEYSDISKGIKSGYKECWIE